MALPPSLRAHPPWPSSRRIPLILLSVLCLLQYAACMTPSQKLELREEARAMFRHGWENYMQRAFPEDEARSRTPQIIPLHQYLTCHQIKPITCIPHHRDREDPKNIGRNDAMGDFSLTAVDTLSSLAVMAASNREDAKRFWETVAEIVRIYWLVGS